MSREATKTDAPAPKTVFDISRIGSSGEFQFFWPPSVSLGAEEKRGPTVGFIFQDTFKRGKQLVAAAAAHSRIQRE